MESTGSELSNGMWYTLIRAILNKICSFSCDKAKIHGNRDKQYIFITQHMNELLNERITEWTPEWTPEVHFLVCQIFYQSVFSVKISCLFQSDRDCSDARIFAAIPVIWTPTCFIQWSIPCKKVFLPDVDVHIRHQSIFRQPNFEICSQLGFTIFKWLMNAWLT